MSIKQDELKVGDHVIFDGQTGVVNHIDGIWAKLTKDEGGYDGWNIQVKDGVWKSDNDYGDDLKFVEKEKEEPETKFKVGDKVNIIGKSLRSELKDSSVKNSSKDNIFYITGIRGDGTGKDDYNCIMVDKEKDTNDGDYFAPHDLELVEEVSDEVVKDIKPPVEAEPLTDEEVASFFGKSLDCSPTDDSEPIQLQRHINTKRRYYSIGKAPKIKL